MTLQYEPAMDTDICDMFHSLSIEPRATPEVVIDKAPSPAQAPTLSRRSSDSSSSSVDDSPMMVTDAQGNVQFLDQAQPSQDEVGCGLLKMLRATYRSQQQTADRLGNAGCYYPPVPYPSTSGSSDSSNSVPDFLETILTHREAFIAFPYGHRTCSKALTQLAFALESRAAQFGADGDLDTAIALHNEAWLMSGWCK